MPYPIETENISKTFIKNTGSFLKRNRKKIKVHALKNVSLQIEPGEIFGLLGPNGAGKTTLVKILTTIIIPDSGTAKVNGYDVVKQSKHARASFGATIGGGERSTYWKMTGLENLNFFGRMYGLTKDEAIKRGLQLLEDMQLLEKKNERVENYSTGMRMKLNFARALISDPPVLIFDEPTLGLDPSFARDLRLYIKNKLQKEDKKTILLTTHYMEEADQLSDRVALIDKGKIIELATPNVLKKSIQEDEVIIITTKEPYEDGLLEKFEGVSKVIQEKESRNLRIHCKNSSEIMLPILEYLKKDNVQIENLTVKQPTLEDAFIRLTGKGLSNND